MLVWILRQAVCSALHALAPEQRQDTLCNFTKLSRTYIVLRTANISARLKQKSVR